MIVVVVNSFNGKLLEIVFFISVPITCFERVCMCIVHNSGYFGMSRCVFINSLDKRQCDKIKKV